VLLEVFDVLWRGSQGKANKLKAGDGAEVTTARILNAPRGLDQRARKCEMCTAEVEGKLYKHYYVNADRKADVMEVCLTCKELMKKTKGR
jgi:hypothetical protein